MFPVYLKPIKISQKLTISGMPPHDVHITVKYSRHEQKPFESWEVLYSEDFVLEGNELQLDLVTIEEFDVWYLEIFVDVENDVGKTRWRSGAFGLLLGGYPPRLWKTSTVFSFSTFFGIEPDLVEITAMPIYWVGIIPKIVRNEIRTVGEKGEKPFNRRVTINIGS